MSVTITQFLISSTGDEVTINLEATVGTFVNQLQLWTMDTYKNYSLAKDLTPLLLQTSNIESLVVTAASLSLANFKDLVFIETKGTPVDTIEQPLQEGVAYALGSYYTCLRDNLLKLSLSDCVDCDADSKQVVIMINMFIDMVIKSLQIGYITQAIDMVNKLKKLCSLNGCTNCTPLPCETCNNFILS